MEKRRCRYEFMDGYVLHRCSRDGLYQEGEKFYCHQHHPETRRKKEEAKSAEWNVKQEKIRALDKQDKAIKVILDELYGLKSLMCSLEWEEVVKQLKVLEENGYPFQILDKTP